MKSKRFISVWAEGGLTQDIEILQDTETGVNYLFVRRGYGGGLTPLLDAQGKPVVTPRQPDEQ